MIYSIRSVFFFIQLYTIIFGKTSHQSLFVIFRRNSHKLQKRGSMPESSGVGAGAGLVKHHGQSHQRRLIISVLFPGLSSQLPGKCRSGGMLMMKRPSCDINNSSQTSIVSGQLSSGEDVQEINIIYHALSNQTIHVFFPAGTGMQGSDLHPQSCGNVSSFEKFSKSNGYHSQVLRVSWNIIGE